MNNVNRIFISFVFLVAVVVWQINEDIEFPPELPIVSQTGSVPAASITTVYGRQHAGTQIRGSGSVVRTLSDDNSGDRHQRFIIRLSSGQTLLVAHNIDLAPRINNIGQNDTVEFNGEYEWNDQGGLVHWTHHDPAGRHASGWLKHQGRTYQ